MRRYMPLNFSTKAGTLTLLKDRLHSARIACLNVFTVGQWKTDKPKCLAQLQETLVEIPWIVRSSCHAEDTADKSRAGAYLTKFDVLPEDAEDAIAEVIEAYGVPLDTDEILVQPMLKDVTRSGVAFSHNPNTCSPHRVVSWKEGADTSAVTGGTSGRVWEFAARSQKEELAELSGITALIEEVLSLFGGIPVDIEFAYTKSNGNDQLWMLQARPLILPHGSETDEEQETRLKTIQAAIERGMQTHPFLMGTRTVYGVMPDWNPAEIIGVRPRPLALALYRELVTDAIWAYQRNNYGYRNLRSFPLMLHFCGLPYIDVRLSFNSFIPADLEVNLAGRLVDYYIQRLLSEPTLHDKVEFEIVFSCYTLDLPERLKELEADGFTKDECNAIAECLRRLTNKVIHPSEGLWRMDTAKLKELGPRRQQLLSSNVDTLEKIYWLIEDCKRYGVLPFAGLARAGFIAVQILRSLVNVEVLTAVDYNLFMAGVTTVSSQMARDKKLLSRETFLEKYGHLRPGTYDILSPRYDVEPDLYFDWENNSTPAEASKPFSLTTSQMKKVTELLKKNTLQLDPVELFDFLKTAIEQRELAKFYFTKNLSDAIELIAVYGADLGFSREDMSYCDVGDFHQLYVSSADPKAFLERSIKNGKLRYEETSRVSLPPVISSPGDIWSFEWPESEPNFITQKQVTAPVVSIENRVKLEGSIVFIPSADPGYDWLFSHKIAGLITVWGGANSHMAIRAGENGLPAVIGAGEILYRKWSKASYLNLDCASRRVEVLS